MAINLGSIFTGAELAAAVNDKLSATEGGAIGDTSIDPEAGIQTNIIKSDSITTATSYGGELIPFHAFKIYSYVGNSNPSDIEKNQTKNREVNLGFQPSLVIIFSHFMYGSREGMFNLFAIADKDSSYITPYGKVLQITNSGFNITQYSANTTLYGGYTFSSYVDLNYEGRNYTALIFV